MGSLLLPNPSLRASDCTYRHLMPTLLSHPELEKTGYEDLVTLLLFLASLLCHPVSCLSICRMVSSFSQSWLHIVTNTSGA